MDMTRSQQPKIILISGPSAAGKTTLGEYLTGHFPDQFEHIRQDDYLRDPSTFPIEGDYQIWEIPENIMFDTLISHIETIRSGTEVPWRTFAKNPNEPVHAYVLKQKPYILIEGSLLFTSDAVLKLADMRIYIDLPLEHSLARRAQRALRWNMDLSAYDTHVVVPAYKRYQELRRRAEHIIDGNKPTEEIAEEVTHILKRAFETKRRESGSAGRVARPESRVKRGPESTSSF